MIPTKNIFTKFFSSYMRAKPLTPTLTIGKITSVKIMTGLLLGIAAIIIMLPFDASLSAQFTASNHGFVKVLRSATDFIRTTIWLTLAALTWLCSFIFLKCGFSSRIELALRRIHQWSAFQLCSLIIAAGIVELGKFFIGRARPALMEQFGAFHFLPLNGTYYFESLPSGHAMCAGTLLASSWFWLPRWRLMTAPMILLLAFSRIPAGAHYPTDVIAGLMCGFLISLSLALFLAKRNIIFLQPSSTA